jgi:hypothetical protein
MLEPSSLGSIIATKSLRVLPSSLDMPFIKSINVHEKRSAKATPTSRSIQCYVLLARHYRIGAFTFPAARDGYNIWGRQVHGHRCRLACVYDEHEALVALCQVHLADDICQLLGIDLFLILKFEKIVSAVPGHVQEHIAVFVRQ